ncbi:RNA polymerase sigma-70 factor, ECF subfamily [Ardenticatena maritima]|uniref:RNA polymerase sigma-70 factor, ECF subfamily n=1 Tax=Ardenticatena maritima TaxID=872965 RepID=A0A0M9UE56_9CHLR|nr:sigma-70 family RNA polymerase sigma factor [Ardenticatena maritima]GAP64680.1 RNA polymerase sigma-70 factor, ECF subfamily [Ardenticatena maritima]
MSTRETIEQELAWVQAALNGDEAAFTALVEAYATPVYNLCYRMLGDAAEAEDAAQETFVRLYRRLHTYDQSRKFSSWVLAIASHHCIDRLRRRRLKQVSIEELPPWQPLVSRRARPEEVVAERDRDERLQALLMELPEDYRLPLVLHYWYGYSYEEICEITGLSLSALKSRLHRARHRLAKLMREKSPDLLPPHARTNGKDRSSQPVNSTKRQNETYS